MVQFPPIGLIDGPGVAVDGHLRLMAAIVLGALFAAYAVLLWAIRRSRTERRRCPVDGRMALVDFRRGPGGTRIDVTACSLRKGVRVDCDKRCLDAA